MAKDKVVYNNSTFDSTFIFKMSKIILNRTIEWRI